MKYFFLINPSAGKNSSALSAIGRAKAAAEKYNLDYEFCTLESGERLTAFVKNLARRPGDFRLYAFGGDGTLNRVINGCAGAENIEVGVVPFGTGNDFIKSTGLPAENFLNFEKQLLGKSKGRDLIAYNGKYCINMCNVGFDADVAMDMPAFKKIPMVSNHGAYYLALLYNFTKKLGRPMKIYCDDRLFFDGEMLMCAVANGISCGGGFYVTAHASTADGLIDVSAVTPPARYKLPGFISYFTKGVQFETPILQEYINFTRCKKVKITSPAPFRVVNDGEGEYLQDVTFEICPNMIRFILPE